MAIFSRSETYGTLACGRLFRNRNAKGFSYNKRTREWAMVPFLPLLAIRRINNLRAVNTLNSSTPVAFTNIYFIINSLQTHFNFVQ